MSAQSPGAFGLSALLHACAAGLLVFFSYAANRSDDDAPKVLELVAGAGDNYAATAAPALGNSGAVKQPVPLPPDPVPATAPAPPEASPIQSAPEPAAKPKPKPTPKPVDLVKDLERAELRREKKLEAQYQKQKLAEQKREAAALAASKVKHIDAEGIRDGVVGGSTENKTGGAGGKALTREEASMMELYFAKLKSEIKEAHVPPEGVADSLSTRVEFFVAADGTLSQAHVIGSSGNADFDLSVIQACEHAHPIGPRPDGRSEMVTFTFKMREDENP